MFVARILFIVIILAAFTISADSVPSSTGLLLVANKGEHTLGLVDPTEGRQIATIAESGITGHEVIASPDGKLAFVPIYGNSGVGLPGTDGRTIDVINLADRRIVHTIDFDRGVRPHCPIFGPKDGMLYVTTELDKAITVIDPRTFKIVGAIPTGQPESHMLAITPDGRYGYTANVGPGTVSVLDIPARKKLAVIPVAEHVQRIAISPDGRWVFTSDTEKPRLAVISTKENKVDRWVPLASPGYGAAPTPDGKWLLVALPGPNEVAVVDLASLAVSKNIGVPSSPQEVLITPDGKMAYVSCSQSARIAAIRVGDWSVKVIEAGPGADGLAWAK